MPLRYARKRRGAGPSHTRLFHSVSDSRVLSREHARGTGPVEVRISVSTERRDRMALDDDFE